MSHGSRSRDAGESVHHSFEWKAQIILLAVVVVVLGSVGFILFPFLLKYNDPGMSLIFAFLIGVVAMFLGGSIVYAYHKVRVGADARKYAEDMVEEALEGRGNGILAQERMRYEDILKEEREKLIGEFEREKQDFADRLRRDFEKRLDDDENTYIEDLKTEFDKQLEKERQTYMEQVRADFERQFAAEKAGVEERIRADLGRRVEEEKKAYAGQVVGDLESRLESEKREYAERLKVDFEGRLEEEKKSYMDIVRKDFEGWKKEFADNFRREMMRDVKPVPQPQIREEKAPVALKPQPLREAPVSAAAPQPQRKDDLSDIFPAEAPRAEVVRGERDYNFNAMSTEQQLVSAVELLLGGKGRGTVVTFTNSK